MVGFYYTNRKIGPTLIQMNSQTCLYFDDIEQVLFYTTQWIIVSYADLNPSSYNGGKLRNMEFKLENVAGK